MLYVDVEDSQFAAAYVERAMLLLLRYAMMPLMITHTPLPRR